MILKNGIDQAALTHKFTDASAKQGETLRKAVHEAALRHHYCKTRCEILI